MRAIVVEDEEFSRKRIVKLLQATSFISEILESGNGSSAVEMINESAPDIVFLDINLQDMTGFDVLQKIKIAPKPIVVFVTAFENHAYRAFDFEAFDFLLKPFKNERFYKTMERMSKVSRTEADQIFERKVEELFLLHKSKTTADAGVQRLPIKLGNKTILIELHRVQYIFASGSYAEIFTEDNKYLTRESLNSLSDILDPKKFFRVHRSTIINVEFVQEIIHSDYSEIDVRMKDKRLFRVSRTQKKEFLKKLGMK